ncbi:TIGR03619 family F420-dependent LLM class oxidoreductase [Rhodococcus sp. Eu-32]|uniref:TIGR03619 family F420-dependent LLM class oxidoreductase n=1 Tax=Rhodococcus sp. Eu-32 TaxID=1017319 RepID=UPI000DF45705|nr:TIGR03619 family F420-dependent LLM class oxidoreductase [Rhodococcus sp. Eu-32]RRQ28988.1 TIGR03619 family F420-dependent LLM class oxidoreductase [Rhodococcus sp. Eu-32]
MIDDRTPPPVRVPHIGIKLPNWGTSASPESISAVARAADRSGFDSLWVSDHVAIPSDADLMGVDSTTAFYEVLTTLGYVGALTDRIQLATGVLVGPLRESVLLAKQVATVDRLTSGRMVLGMGAGWLQGEFDALGRDWSGRGRALGDSIVDMREAWRCEQFVPRGTSTSVGSAPRPVRDSVPVVLGGNSTAALARAARLADGWYGANLTPDEFASTRATLIELGADVPSGFRMGIKPKVVHRAVVGETVAAYAHAGADFVVLDVEFSGMSGDESAGAVVELAEKLQLSGTAREPLEPIMRRSDDR